MVRVVCSYAMSTTHQTDVNTGGPRRLHALSPNHPISASIELRPAIIAGVDKTLLRHVLRHWAAAATDGIAHPLRRDRLLVTKQEAAALLSMSVDHFERHVQPRLRVHRSGSKVLIPRAELDRYIEETSTLTLRRP